ncbi:unnamed protein product [Phytomonas sp. Hart1]|nr:unnamed protein product [Phytomonas sp. Hart1]|eukprot:CCW65955.1 unnamed protein product [Phytomonas sp. isolate Hart1]
MSFGNQWQWCLQPLSCVLKACGSLLSSEMQGAVEGVYSFFQSFLTSLGVHLTPNLCLFPGDAATDVAKGGDTWSATPTLLQLHSVLNSIEEDREGRLRAIDEDSEADHDEKGLSGTSLPSQRSISSPQITPRSARKGPSAEAMRVRKVERGLIGQLLGALNTFVRITHAGAMDVQLLELLITRATSSMDAQYSNREAKEEADGFLWSDESANADEVFIEFDLAAKSSAASFEAPQSFSRVTYEEAVKLTCLVSEALAWESYLLHVNDALGFSGKDSTAAMSSRKCVRGVETSVQSVRIGMMLSQCAEYDLLWCACARSGALHTFLQELYDGQSFKGVPTSISPTSLGYASAHGGHGIANTSSSVYYYSTAALINTNLSTNAMLYEAIESAGCCMIVLEARYLPLLFVAEEESPCLSPRVLDSTSPGYLVSLVKGGVRGEQSERKEPFRGRRVLRVPSSLRRIFLWRWDGCYTGDFTSEMRDALDFFNRQAYADLPLALRFYGTSGDSATREAPIPVTEADVENESPQTTPVSARADLRLDLQCRAVVESRPAFYSNGPSLDLYDQVGGFLVELPTTFTGNEADRRRKDLEDVCRGYLLLLQRILAHPPRWLRCNPAGWSQQVTPRANLLPSISLPDGAPSALRSPASSYPFGAAASIPGQPSKNLWKSTTSGGISTPQSPRDSPFSPFCSVSQLFFSRLYVRAIAASIMHQRFPPISRRVTEIELTPRTRGGGGGLPEGAPLASARINVEGTPRRRFTGPPKKAIDSLFQLEYQLAFQQKIFYKRLYMALRRFTLLQPLLCLFPGEAPGEVEAITHLSFFGMVSLSGDLCSPKPPRRGGLQPHANGAMIFTKAHVATTEVLHLLRQVWTRHEEKWAMMDFLLWGCVVCLVGIPQRVLGILQAGPGVPAGMDTRAGKERFVVYNSLRMDQFDSCVFCFGYLMHLLQEQQKGQRGRRLCIAKNPPESEGSGTIKMVLIASRTI